MTALALTCHAATPCVHVRAVSVRTDRVRGGLLRLRYRVEGDLERLELPDRRQGMQTDDLWRHTCFEAFAKRGDTSAYLELNFSPSSEWAMYRFDDYRHGMQPVAPSHPPEIACRRRGDLLETDVHVHLDHLFIERGHVDELRLAVAAVLEDRQRQLSYWALAHPMARPDFHHADSFVLSLSAPGAAI